MSSQTHRIPTIIPVAGGKGGVGKSLFTACLTRHIAATGRVCTAVDLDLGGSNLHSFFGFDNIHAGVGDFLASKGEELDAFKVAVPGSMHAGFVPGDGLRPFLANLSHGQKMRLLRDLTRMNAEVVLLDLGAGSSFNTLDFFRVWGRGVLLTTPEHTSIMNMMSFAKNVVLRIIAKGSQGNTYMEEICNQTLQQSMLDKIRTIPEVLAEMGRASAKRTESIRQQLSGLQFDLVVNQVRDLSELDFVRSVQSSLQNRLGLKVNWQGCLLDQPQSRIGLIAQDGAAGFHDMVGVAPIARRIALGEVVSSDVVTAEAQNLFQSM